jgi:succinate dehydrogenase/fumarate reductase cytochrome b subunit
MRTIHRYSGILIAVFVALHLLNHAGSLFGAAAHIELMDSLRVFYRSPIAETLLLGAVLVQIVSGLKLFWQTRQTAMTDFDTLHRWTGLYLAIFFVIHLSAVLSGRYILHLDTNFYFGVAGLNTFPLNLFFVPYYGLAILSVFGHVAAVHSKKMKQPVAGLSLMAQAKTILIVGFVLTIVIFYGLTNGFRGVAIPAKYDVLIGR